MEKELLHQDGDYKIFKSLAEVYEAPNDFDQGFLSKYYLFNKNVWSEDHDIDADNVQEFMDEVKKLHPDNVAIKTLYKYQHSGAALNFTAFSCKWDSGLIGFAVLDKKDLDNVGLELKNKKDILSLMETELEQIENYINGWVYDVFMEAPDYISVYYLSYSDKDIDSVVEEIKKEIKYEKLEKIKSFIKRKKVEIKNRVPFKYRTQFKEVLV
jgi:hypothetical protein